MSRLASAEAWPGAFAYSPGVEKAFRNEPRVPSVCAEVIAVRDGVAIAANCAEAKLASSAIERLYWRSPWLYNSKTWLLERLNPWPALDLTPHVSGRRVLNVGCGPRNAFFDEAAPSELVGFDTSPFFIRWIQARSRRGFYYVGSVESIPFPDDYFDTSVLAFVLHHLPFPQQLALQEVARVTRNTLIIYDHRLSDRAPQRWIQAAYWRLFDGGTKYNTESEWNELFRNFRVVHSRYTGRLFQNISQFVLEKTG